MSRTQRIVRALARYNTATPPEYRRRAKVEAWLLVVLVVAAFVWGIL
jgi:hypothetical protein